MTLIFFAFIACSIAGFLREDLKKNMLTRSQEEWTVDLAGLVIQGIFIPALPFGVKALLTNLFPDTLGLIDIHPAIQFITSFVLIDYIYYWNHRCFHSKHFWYLHRLHHSARHLDVLATSRNSLFTSLLFIYIWAQIAALYFLKDCAAFLLGLSLTFALDLWRHSGLEVRTLFRKILGWALILPEQHVLHHSIYGRTMNYGANFNWWDKLHGTYSEDKIRNSKLEQLSNKDYVKELLFPARSGR
jgi:sterol desaturase/sphingolipid hydroxylase (fatty acid hydroxylase superfamily)